MMQARRVVVLGTAGLGLMGLTVLQARGAATGAPGAAAPRPAAVVSAEGQVVTYPGYEVVVGSERAGRLVAMNVIEGQAVRKGQLLAEIESEELRASLAEAEARVREADAEVRLAELSLKRRQDLAAQQIVAAHDLDQSLRDLETARARRETAAAAVDLYRAQLRKTRIVAPIDGTVVARHTDSGATVESGNKVVTLADLGRVRVEGEADEADAGSIALGASVAITAEGYPGRSWRGRVEEIPSSVTLRRLKPQDPAHPTDTRILAVKVAFEEPTPLKLGTTVELKIQSLRP